MQGVFEVHQKDGRSFKAESLRFVFHQTATGRPWSSDNVYRNVYADLLRIAKVRYRGPNQLRHTFASWLLTQSVPLEWIAPIMGTSVQMLKKHYAKMIPEDRPDLGRIIAEILRGQQERLDQTEPEIASNSPKTAQFVGRLL
jgi:integrase